MQAAGSRKSHGQVQSALHVTPGPQGDPASHCSPTSTDPFPQTCGHTSVGFPPLTTTSCPTHSSSTSASIVGSAPVQEPDLANAAENFVSALARQPVSTRALFSAAFA